jgi:hypothetical protein
MDDQRSETQRQQGGTDATSDHLERMQRLSEPGGSDESMATGEQSVESVHGAPASGTEEVTIIEVDTRRLDDRGDRTVQGGMTSQDDQGSSGAETVGLPPIEDKFRAAEVREELNINPNAPVGPGYVGQGLDPTGDVADTPGPLAPHLSANIGIARQDDYLREAEEDRMADRAQGDRTDIDPADESAGRLR